MKLFITFLFILLSQNIFSQSFRGFAIYEWKESSENFRNQILDDSKMDLKVKKVIDSRIDNMFHKVFKLSFDLKSSIYEESARLDFTNYNGNISWSSNEIEISYIKDIQTKKLIIVTDFMSKVFNIVDSLPNFNWKLELDTKKIGKYLCNKATIKFAKTTSELDEFEDENSTSINPTTPFESELENGLITAWYTNEIPIGQGPGKYWGLPGLILEINTPKTKILCTKIVLNSKGKLDIRIPKNKEISRKNFDNLVIEKIEEMNEIDGLK